MSNTNINFYRGCHGMGILIEVSYLKDRVIFDFGAPFNPSSEIFDGTVKARNINRVKDAILLNKTMAIDGLFSKKDLQDLSVIPYEDSDYNTAILICHLHEDHMSEIDKVDKHIPVYIHADGLKMLEAINKMENKTIYRSYSSFEYEQCFYVGCIKVTPYFSDHICAGSASFLIETPDKKIVYSGDIRYHGVNSDKAFKVMENFNDKNIDLLIVDSTTTSPSEFIMNEELIKEYKIPSKEYLKGEIKEQDIYDDTYNSLKGFDGIGIVNFYPRDISTMKNIYDLGFKLNRTAVFEPYYAYILYKLTGIIPTVIEPINSDCSDYINELRQLCPFVSIKDIRNNYNNFILQNSYNNILDLIDLDGINGRYFHLLGIPFTQDTKEYKIMVNFADKLNFGFKTYSNLYSYSHAYPNHLAYIVEKVNAKYVVAVHSKHPENLNPCNSKQLFPIEGVKYNITDDGFIEI